MASDSEAEREVVLFLVDGCDKAVVSPFAPSPMNITDTLPIKKNNMLSYTADYNIEIELLYQFIHSKLELSKDPIIILSCLQPTLQTSHMVVLINVSCC